MIRLSNRPHWGIENDLPVYLGKLCGLWRLIGTDACYANYCERNLENKTKMVISAFLAIYGQAIN